MSPTYKNKNLQVFGIYLLVVTLLSTQFALANSSDPKYWDYSGITLDFENSTVQHKNKHLNTPFYGIQFSGTNFLVAPKGGLIIETSADLAVGVVNTPTQSKFQWTTEGYGSVGYVTRELFGCVQPYLKGLVSGHKEAKSTGNIRFGAATGVLCKLNGQVFRVEVGLAKNFYDPHQDYLDAGIQMVSSNDTEKLFRLDYDISNILHFGFDLKQGDTLSEKTARLRFELEPLYADAKIKHESISTLAAKNNLSTTLGQNTQADILSFGVSVGSAF